jgi:ArsR family transcriptional regulator
MTGTSGRSHADSAPEQLFQVLGNRTRLRVLRALQDRELGVGELAEALRMPQSSASKHLALLRDAGLVRVRREATSTYYAALDGPELLRPLLAASLAAIEEADADQLAVERVVAARSARSVRFFSTVGALWEGIRQEYGGLETLLVAMSALVPRLGRVLDLGTGTGHLLPALRGLADHVVALDQTPAMLAGAARRERDAGGGEGAVDLLAGDAMALPLTDASLDAAFASHVLRHVPQPARAVAEMARVLRPGGACVLIDFCPHQQEWLREERAHLWLGFAREELEAWARPAGLALLGYRTVHPSGNGNGARRMPDLFVAHARRLGRGASRD